MAGYCGYSMSNNAVYAYENGEKPYSKWTKASIVEELKYNNINSELISRLIKYPIAVLKQCLLYTSSYHHTSKFYNKTDFYSIDLDSLDDEADLFKYLEETKQKLSEKKDKPQMIVYCDVSYIEWYGVGRRRRKRTVNASGYIQGTWFFGNNGVKKNVKGKYFDIIRRHLMQ